MTLYESIIKEFEAIGSWEFAGKVSSKLSYELQKKASNIERRMRELHQKGVLEAKLVKVEGVPNKVVCYKIREPEKSIWDLPKKVEEKPLQTLFN